MCRCRTPTGSRRCCGTSTTPRSDWSLHVCEASRGHHSTWATNRRASARAHASATYRAPRWSCASPRSTRSGASTRGCGSARTSTSCGDSTTPVGDVATTLPCRCGTNRGRRGASGCGSTPATAPRRRRWRFGIRARLSPVHMNGWTAATWALALLGRWVPAIVLGAGSSAALVRKLPDVPPAAAMWLAARGHLLAGRQLASASRRVWWPILVAGAVLSRRGRWWLLLALVDNATGSADRPRLRVGRVDGMRRIADLVSDRSPPQRLARASALNGPRVRSRRAPAVRRRFPTTLLRLPGPPRAPRSAPGGAGR